MGIQRNSWDPREVQKKKNLLQTQNDITLSQHNLAHCDRYLYTVKIMDDHDQQQGQSPQICTVSHGRTFEYQNLSNFRYAIFSCHLTAL